MNLHKHKLVNALGLALAVAVLAAPAALGRGGSGLDPWAYNAVYGSQGTSAPMGQDAATPSAIRPDDRTGVRGPASPTAAPWYTPRELKALNAYSNASFAQKKALLAASDAASTAARPDDRAGIRGPSTPTALPQLAQISDHATFNWRDAGIGALAALTAVLLATSATLLALRRRRTAHAIGGLANG